MTTLTWDHVVRFRSARHFLTQRFPLSTKSGEGVGRVVFALGSDGLKTGAVNEMLLEKWLVKTWAMGGLLHLLTADDLPLYVAAMRTTRIAYRKLSWLKSFDTDLEEIESIIAAVHTVLDGQTLTREDLADGIVKVAKVPRQRDRLRSGWGDFLKIAAYHGHLMFGPNQGKNVTFVRPDQWLNNWYDINPEEAMRTIARRYFAAYGPSSRDEFSEWWGDQGSESRHFFRLMADELVEVDIEGWKGLMLAEDVQAAQNVSDESFFRLLPAFDNYTVAAYHERGLLLAEAFLPRVYRKNDAVAPIVLLDGRIVGVWKYEQKRGRLLVSVEPFAPLSSPVQTLLEAEVTRLGEFLSAPADLSYHARE